MKLWLGIFIGKGTCKKDHIGSRCIHFIVAAQLGERRKFRICGGLMQTPLACLHLRKHALGAMMSGLDAVKPRALLPKFIQRTPTNIVIASTPNFIQPIAEVEQIIVVGGGKVIPNSVLMLRVERHQERWL